MAQLGRPGNRMPVGNGYGKLTYAQKVERRICVRCHATRLPEEIYARCDECLEEIARQHRTKYHRSGWRKKRQYYRDNKAEILKAKQERNTEKKLRGECRDCPGRATRNSIFCRSCEKKRSDAAAKTWDEQRWKPMSPKESEDADAYEGDAGTSRISRADDPDAPAA